MNGSTLAHYGIPGMKWGVRRYQNEDGTLTAAGKERYDRDVRENLAKKKENRIDTSDPDPSRWVKEDLSRSKKLVDSGNSMIKDARKLATSSTSKKSRLDLSKMTNKELQEKIDRETLERRYNDLFNTAKASKGQQYVEKALEAVGGLLAAGSTALGIALAIKELKG